MVACNATHFHTSQAARQLGTMVHAAVHLHTNIMYATTSFPYPNSQRYQNITVLWHGSRLANWTRGSSHPISYLEHHFSSAVAAGIHFAVTPGSNQLRHPVIVDVETLQRHC